MARGSRVTARDHPASCGICAVQRSFCGLPEDIRATFEGLKTRAAYEKGAVLFHESDPLHSVFVVCEGSVKLMMVSRQGRILLLRVAGPGEVLGLAEVVAGVVTYQCSAIAAERSLVAMIPREKFMKFIASYPEASLRLTVTLSEQYRVAQRETRFLAFGATSTARLARLLLEWSSQREEADKDPFRIPSPLTQAELGQAIGASRETVTRILADLNDRGIIDRTAGEIVIHKPEELVRLLRE